MGTIMFQNLAATIHQHIHLYARSMVYFIQSGRVHPYNLTWHSNFTPLQWKEQDETDVCHKFPEREDKLKAGLRKQFYTPLVSRSTRYIYRKNECTNCQSGCIDEAVGASLLVSFRLSPSISAEQNFRLWKHLEGLKHSSRVAHKARLICQYQSSKIELEPISAYTHHFHQFSVVLQVAWKKYFLFEEEAHEDDFVPVPATYFITNRFCRKFSRSTRTVCYYIQQ